jgi:hypothetical protein
LTETSTGRNVHKEWRDGSHALQVNQVASSRNELCTTRTPLRHMFGRLSEAARLAALLAQKIPLQTFKTEL